MRVFSRNVKCQRGLESEQVVLQRCVASATNRMTYVRLRLCVFLGFFFVFFDVVPRARLCREVFLVRLSSLGTRLRRLDFEGFLVRLSSLDTTLLSLALSTSLTISNSPSSSPLGRLRSSMGPLVIPVCTLLKINRLCFAGRSPVPVSASNTSITASCPTSTCWSLPVQGL